MLASLSAHSDQPDMPTRALETTSCAGATVSHKLFSLAVVWDTDDNEVASLLGLSGPELIRFAKRSERGRRTAD